LEPIAPDAAAPSVVVNGARGDPSCASADAVVDLSILRTDLQREYGVLTFNVIQPPTEQTVFRCAIQRRAHLIL
jgi:hypothetical protein